MGQSVPKCVRESVHIFYLKLQSFRTLRNEISSQMKTELGQAHFLVKKGKLKRIFGFWAYQRMVSL